MAVSIGWTLLVLGILGVGLVFAGYPALVRLVAAARPAGPAPGAPRPIGRISVIVAMRNAEALLPPKLASLRAQEGLDVPLEIVLASDGSTDRTADRIRAEAERDPAVRAVIHTEHGGKHVALNAAFEVSTGDVLVFSDADAVLDPHAVARLVARLGDSSIGGVCGRRMIGEPDAFTGDAQGDYVALDSGLKALESRIGSITSNDGKLYAVAREAFEPIAEGVTDDLYAALCVVRQGLRFVYEGGARAWIRVPSRGASHELGRRRRIVCRSLRGIWSQRAVLNPFRTGLFAFGLLVNKVGRRLLPVFLLMLAAGLALLATVSQGALLAFVLVVGGVAAALLRPSVGALKLPKPLERVLALGRYFVVGNAGTLLGTLDFLRGKRVVRWNPIKGT